MFQVGHISPFNAQWLLYVPSGLTLKILRSTHTVNLRVAYGSQNKGQLVPRTLTDWFLKLRRCVYCAVRTEPSNGMQINHMAQAFGKDYVL